jgi:hypothetical protein
MIHVRLFTPHSPAAKNGISTRFLSYITHIDKTIGQKVVGPDQTVSGKVTDTAKAGYEQARALDEQKGISKTATDVRVLPPPFAGLRS